MKLRLMQSAMCYVVYGRICFKLRYTHTDYILSHQIICHQQTNWILNAYPRLGLPFGTQLIPQRLLVMAGLPRGRRRRRRRMCLAM